MQRIKQQPQAFHTTTFNFPRRLAAPQDGASGTTKPGFHSQPARLPSAPSKNPEMAPRRHGIVESVAARHGLKSPVVFSTSEPKIYG
ncbi:MAG TPA: hypothetical protein VJ723_12475, partial [Candidatus Angelobacter sp.]|jgi:hypothetical protein|nr:hypothetical protein [Candidatus Angelobacter sp.]